MNRQLKEYPEFTLLQEDLEGFIDIDAIFWPPSPFSPGSWVR